MLRKFLPLRAPMAILASVLLATSVATIGVSLGAASPAFASVTVCLTNAPGQCADVKDAHDVAGNPIWLWHNGNDYHWLEVTHQCGIGKTCFFLEDARAPGLCLTAVGTNGTRTKLENCSDAGSWFNEGGNRLGNGFYGASGSLMTNGSANGYYLSAAFTGTWHQWNF